MVGEGVLVTKHSLCRVRRFEGETMSKDRQKTYKYRGRSLTVSFVRKYYGERLLTVPQLIGPEKPEVRSYGGTQAGECSKSRDCHHVHVSVS